MPLDTDKSPTEELAAGRAIAEQVLADAETGADLLRVAHARALLSDAFPEHSVAVFIRNWDEDRPHLAQLLTTTDGTDDVDLTDDADAAWQKLTVEQRQAFNEAERIIRLLGDDERLRSQIDAYGAEYEYEHHGWYEFDLPLRAAEEA